MDYWKDVGTVESLWEAHMDLIGRNIQISSWMIRNGKFLLGNANHPPQYISKDAEVT